MAKLKEAGTGIEVQVESKATLVSFDLPERMGDEEIEAELPTQHLFGVAEVYAVIAGLIAKQTKGEDGALLANGNWNLFYTDRKVVRVRWFDGGWYVGCWWFDGGWYVGCWVRGDGWWAAGGRVFSPATDSSDTGTVEADLKPLLDEVVGSFGPGLPLGNLTSQL